MAVGFHCVKGEPDMQMEAHHYCKVVNGEMLQCVLFDGNTADAELMGHLVNSYGKTWHTWRSTPMGSAPAEPLPIGDPMLMWSFNREGEVDSALQQDRNRVMGTDPEPRKASRARYLDRAHPQRGVGTMRDDFTDTTPTPGVVDAEDGQP